jgi:hypothetical protein
VGNIAAIFIFLELFSYAYTKRMGGELALFNGLMISRLPLMLALIVPILGISLQVASVATLAVAQLASIGLLSIFLSLSKGIKQEVTIIVCLALLYFNLLFFVG